MKNIKDYILESKEQVYAVYFGDGILDTYFKTEDEANKRKDELNNEVKTNNCVVKKEPLSNIEKI